MSDLTHRILFLAGTTLLAAAVVYGAPSKPAWLDQADVSVPVRLAAAADLVAAVAPGDTMLNRKSAHRTDTVKPNAASCPGANTAPLNGESTDSTVQNSEPAPMPNGKVASACPAAGSDAQTDIARGPALARPEPLNSKQLIVPRAKTPG